MLDGRPLVKEFPEAPEEITIYQAIGLLHNLERPKSQKALMAHYLIHDPVVRTWVLASLMHKANRLDGNLLQAVMHVARRSAFLRRLAVPLLLKAFRFDLVAKIEEMETAVGSDIGKVNAELLKAVRLNDYKAQVALHEKLYLYTGNLRHITEARDIARLRLNWKDALKPMLRVIFTHLEPLQGSIISLLRMLEREDAREEFKSVARSIHGNNDIKLAIVYAAAQLHYWEKNYERTIKIFEESGVLDATKDRLSLINNLVASSYEKLGDYEKAGQWYKQQNDALKKADLKAERFMSELDRRAGWNIPKLPPAERDNYFIMTGFPRSGTTLLENALASHPDIATCEETSSLIGSIHTAYTSKLAQDPDNNKIGLRALLHRNLYFQNLTRYVDKPDPKVIIDKTPIIGANIKYLEKIVPEMRYIFSIRHPYDVVLSNYKQDYAQNIAMAAFNDIFEACVQYDYVMRNWFEVFPGETDRVYYIKYDELVNDFDRVIGGALDHLGVDWTDEVRNFAENSSNRAVRTPSYANVRKGLTIGVQTSWQKFEFLFDDKCRELLDPWVERHGYAA